jgi:hypothetical protein
MSENFSIRISSVCDKIQYSDFQIFAGCLNIFVDVKFAEDSKVIQTLNRCRCGALRPGSFTFNAASD